jgi:hypothetical protein
MSVRLALSAVLLVLLLPQAAAARIVPQGFYGVVYDGAVTSAPASVQDAQFAQMARSGVESVRTVFSWSDAQPVQGGPIDFGHTDQLVASAAAHRIDVLPVVIYAPAWARQDSSLFNSPPAQTAGYVAYLQALVARYGPSGSFWAEHPQLPRRPLRTWQVWNEPQLRFQWNAPGFATGYGQLLQASYEALKAADPGCTVVLAGATNLSWEIIAQLYRQGGIHGFFDVVAVHPYTATPAHVARIVELVRQVLRSHHDARVPIWVTELGFPASKGRVRSHNTLQTTPRVAATRLGQTYALLARERRNPRLLVGRVYWYTWASSYRGPDIFSFSGLFRFAGGGFQRQLQLAAYVRSAQAHEGCAKTSTGACR